MEREEAKPEHRWLHKLLGDWTYEMPGQDGKVYTGKSHVRKIGELWIQEEMDMGDDLSLMTLGYDANKKRYVGTFLSTMGGFLWVYDGALDEKGRMLVLDAEGPDMQDPKKLSRYRDVVEIVSDDERMLRGQFWKDGDWVELMRMTFRRVR